MKKPETNPQKVRRLRKKAGLTKKELALELGFKAWDIEVIEEATKGGSRAEIAIIFLECYLGNYEAARSIDVKNVNRPFVLMPPIDSKKPLTQQKYEEREIACIF